MDKGGKDYTESGGKVTRQELRADEQHGVPIACRARAVESSDYEKFDYILAMDTSKYVSYPLADGGHPDLGEIWTWDMEGSKD